MNDDDPRHGTPRGYRLHRDDTEDACEPCATAWYRYNKRATYLRSCGNPLRVPSLGTHRRIHALMTLGYGLPILAGHLGIATGNLSYKLQQPGVARQTHDNIADLYEQLSMQPPPSGWVAQRTRTIAAKRGWPPPLAWDDIDNPAETPEGWQYKPGTRADEIRDLADNGAGITEAASRLHIGRKSVEKWCARHGLMDVYRTLASRELSGFCIRSEHIQCGSNKADCSCDCHAVGTVAA